MGGASLRLIDTITYKTSSRLTERLQSSSSDRTACIPAELSISFSCHGRITMGHPYHQGKLTKWSLCFIWRQEGWYEIVTPSTHFCLPAIATHFSRRHSGACAAKKTGHHHSSSDPLYHKHYLQCPVFKLTK